MAVQCKYPPILHSHCRESLRIRMAGEKQQHNCGRATIWFTTNWGVLRTPRAQVRATASRLDHTWRGSCCSRAGSPTEPAASIWAVLADQWVPGVLQSPSSQCWGPRCVPRCPAVYKGAGEPNSCPHVWGPSTLPTECQNTVQEWSHARRTLSACENTPRQRPCDFSFFKTQTCS